MLNDAQRTSLKIALRLIDQKMRKIETLLEKPKVVGVIYEVQDDLSPALLGQLPGKIAAVRAILKDLMDRFDLSREITLASSEAFKGLPYLWEVLQESTSRRLRRYGPVDDRLGPVLDPEVQKLEALIIEMESIINESRRTEVLENSGRQASATEKGQST